MLVEYLLGVEENSSRLVSTFLEQVGVFGNGIAKSFIAILHKSSVWVAKYYIRRKITVLVCV